MVSQTGRNQLSVEARNSHVSSAAVSDERAGPFCSMRSRWIRLFAGSHMNMLP